ncbi:phage tail protein [Streptomyces sp. NPDC048282]|uniref:phage tail protein n=1 Tax=Streptomyces sp. NPDC048282 TaxID=3365528 RepID=UPI003717E4BB
MTPAEPDRPVYRLLPEVHRSRDAELGHPLRSLLEVVEEELLRLREDIDGLYDNWFVETCAAWVLPYLADLLGPGDPTGDPGGTVPRRALVAHTLAHRRRKGTPGALQEAARDITGRPVRVVEYFPLLGTTQNVNHPRPGDVRTPDLRDTARLALIGTPFDRTSRTVDVRHADRRSGYTDRRRGRHNIGVVGLHLWRLTAHPCTGVDARAVDAAAGRWTFDPAGRDLPLFSRPRSAAPPVDETDVPAPLRRLRLHQELTALRTGSPSGLLDGPDPLLTVTLPDGPVEPARLICADLTGWDRPPAPSDGAAPQIAVDPALGRLTLPPGTAPDRVRVAYSYGSPGDLGAGPYDRRATLTTALAAAGTPWPDAPDWRIAVRRDPAGSGDPSAPSSVPTVTTLAAAVTAWNERPDPRPGQVGVIAVQDSATYDEDLTGPRRILIPPGNRLIVLAAGGRPAALGAFGLRPHLTGTIEAAAPGGQAAQPSQLVLDGLSVEGRITVAPGNLDSLVVSGCTLAGDRAATLPDGGLITAEDNPRLAVRLARTVCAGVRLSDVPTLDLADSIVGPRADGLALDAQSADAGIEASTVLGRTTARTLTVSDSILRDRAEVVWRQQGYLRFSYAPPDSRVPRRYRCQPADDTAARRVAPAFDALDPAAPGFGRLAARCPAEIAEGAENGEEMGAYRFLRQPGRLADLAGRLDDHLRFGLEAGVFLAD